jgi:WD40 repeat protein
MPPSDKTLLKMMAVVTAPTLADSCRLLERFPELHNAGMIDYGISAIDLALAVDPTEAHKGWTRGEAEAALKACRALLVRCKQVGVSRAIADIEGRGGFGRRSLETERSLRRPRRRRRRIIIGISLLAVAGAIAGTVVLLTSPGPHGNNYYVAVSPNGKFIASASSITDNVYLWDTASRRLIATLADPHRATDSVNAIALSPGGTMIAVAHTNDPVYIWNIVTRRVVAAITAGAGDSGLAFSPDGKTLAICGSDVLLWDVAGKRIKATLTTVKNSTNGSPAAVAFSPDGRTLAVSINANQDQNGHYLAPGIELWDLRTRRVTANLKGGAGSGPVAYSRDGRTLVATEFGGGSLSLWDVTAKPRLKAEPSDPQPNARTWSPVGIYPVVFSPDGTTVATSDGSPANSAYLYNAATGQLIATLTDPNSLAVADLAYTPDGGTLITADGNGNIYLWNLGTRQVAATLTMPNS